MYAPYLGNGKKSILTNPQICFLEEHWKECDFPELAEKFTEEFGRYITAEELKQHVGFNPRPGMSRVGLSWKEYSFLLGTCRQFKCSDILEIKKFYENNFKRKLSITTFRKYCRELALTKYFRHHYKKA